MNSQLKPAKILIVDDEPVLLESCAKILQGEGLDVQTVTRGMDALEVFDRVRFDVVILDLMLPDVDGMTVLRQMRMRRSEIVVVIITGFATEASSEEAMQIGAFEYIPKPFTAMQLRHFTGRAVQHAQTRRGTAAAKVCECGCGESPKGGSFCPGHDQRLRKKLEDRVGGLLPMRTLVDAAESYARGEASLDAFSDQVRRLFAPASKRE